MAMFGDACGVWLNGWEQFQERARSRKHRKKTRQATNRHVWRSVDAAAVTTGTTSSSRQAADPEEAPEA
eukprot:5700293-Lingulodinium_polyedra.AAC.1